MQTQILGLLTPLMGLGFAATFFMLWHIGKLRRHVLWLAIAYTITPIGYLSTHLLPTDAVYVFHLTQAIYTVGVTIFVAAICDRVGQRLHLPSMVVIYAISAIALAVAVAMTNDVGPRLIIVNTGYGVMIVMGIAVLLNAQRRSMVDLAVICVLALQAADFLVRPNMTLMFERTIAAEAYRGSMYYSLIGLVLGIKSVVTAMVLVGATIAEWTANLRASGDRDTLTGLRNRGAFEEEMRTMIPRAQAEGRPLSLVVADIDHFKQVNDIWGHQAGDRAISGFGSLIEEMVRGCDVSGRIGGEEFCIAVWNCPNEPAERLAERIRQAFAKLEHEGLNDDIRLTASFGVATAHEGETYERLFARADAALYRAKSSGRNRVENAEDSHELGHDECPERATVQPAQLAAG